MATMVELVVLRAAEDGVWAVGESTLVGASRILIVVLR